MLIFAIKAPETLNNAHFETTFPFMHNTLFETSTSRISSSKIAHTTKWHIWIIVLILRGTFSSSWNVAFDQIAQVSNESMAPKCFTSIPLHMVLHMCDISRCSFRAAMRVAKCSFRSGNKNNSTRKMAAKTDRKCERKHWKENQIEHGKRE